MLKKEKVSKLIQADKKKKAVSWNDKQMKEKIADSFLEINSSASPSREEIDVTIHTLMLQGYTPIEAYAMTGKSILADGTINYNNPDFYESLDSIEQRKSNTPVNTEVKTSTLALEQGATNFSESALYESKESPEERSALANETENNRYSFFSAENLELGMTALALAATVAITAFMK